MENSKPKKKWIFTICGAIILAVGAFIFFYGYNNSRVFTTSEYIKEVIIQNESFENLFDEFLDKVANYNGSQKTLEELENSKSKLNKFVETLDKKLGPKVPNDSKQHYDKMMNAYEIYLEAADLYKKATLKNSGNERNDLIQRARNQLSEAKKSMKNLD